MQADEVLRFLIAHSGLSTRTVSTSLGHSTSWASVATQPGRIPRLDTAASVADIAGVDFVLLDRETGERLGIVEPPPRG